MELLFGEKLTNISSYKCLFSNDSNIKLNYEFQFEENIIDYNIEYDTRKRFMVETLLANGKPMLERMGESAKSYITDNQLFTDLDKDTLLLRSIYFNTKFNNYDILNKWFRYLLNSVYLDASLRKGVNPGNSFLGLKEYLENNGVEEINSFFREYNFGQVIEYSKTSNGNLISIDTEGEKNIFFKGKKSGSLFHLEWSH